jgi:cobalt-zinc-cadmium resistance protein CzcA
MVHGPHGDQSSSQIESPGVIARLIAFSVNHRSLMLGLTAVIAVTGIWAFRQMPIDAYPDISAQQVLIISQFSGRAPEEIERQVTVPIELAMGSVPNVQAIRSRTIFGLSIVELVFEEGVDNYFARQRVQERLAGIALPKGVETELGPLATAFCEIYRYELKSDASHDLMALRTINDWVVVPRLMRTPGVAEVTNFGGREKQYTVKLNPGQLERFNLSLADVIEAVQENNSNAGGSILRRGDMSFVIRGRGTLTNERDLQETVVNTLNGTPIYVRDVARVELASRTPAGIFGKDDVSESVEGIVLMRRGENPSRTLERVLREVEEINGKVFEQDAMLKGVQIEPFYNRQFLVDKTLETVTHSVVCGICLILLVLLVFLGSPSMALLVSATVPFSLLFALVVMWSTGIPIGLLSLGAIDFGILVDGSVIMADVVGHALAAKMLLQKSSQQHTITESEIKDTVVRAAVSVERPIFYSMLMIVSAYVPLLSLTSIEGLLFRPMALTVIYALIGAVLFSLFVLPGIATWLFRNGYQDSENPVLVFLRPAYAAVLKGLVSARWLVLVTAVAAFCMISWQLLPRLGFDFLPYLDEGTIWVRANFPEGTALQKSSEYADELRSLIREFPEVSFAVSQAGRNDSGTDPFVPSRVEILVGLKPMEQWTVATKHELIAAMGDRLRSDFPTTRFNFTQPIIDSVTEDTNGTSADLAVEFSGGDPDTLRLLGQQTVELLRTVPGALDVNIEQEGPQPQLIITPNRARCARFDVDIDDVNQVIDIALGGGPVGELYEGERRFEITVRYDASLVKSGFAIRQLPVHSNTGIPVPLVQVADFEIKNGQTLIARESSRRRITVRCNIVGRDQGSFVAEAQKIVGGKVVIPPGCTLRWIGMFENLERATKHFMYVIPVTGFIIYVLLVMTFGTQREPLLLLFSAPLALIGGAVALYVRGMTLNVSSGVGFAALFGVSIMNGVLMLEWIVALRSQGKSLDEAIVQGALDRLRPIMMASLVAILGLVPASLATGLGSDVQRPLATVIVWGLFSSMLLSLLILPALYRIVASPDRR